MAGVAKNKLSAFMESGIYRFHDSNAVFIDPVRILNRNYSRIRVSPSVYYSRFFDFESHAQESRNLDDEAQESRVSESSRKRKRNQKKMIKQHCTLNEKELLAEQRHQEIRPLLVKAHEDLIRSKELLELMCELNREKEGWEPCVNLSNGEVKEEVSFIELGKVWQAPFYEITIDFSQYNEDEENEASATSQNHSQRLLPIFDNLV